jgi:hypothetical protein
LCGKYVYLDGRSKMANGKVKGKEQEVLPIKRMTTFRGRCVGGRFEILLFRRLQDSDSHCTSTGARGRVHSELLRLPVAAGFLLSFPG